MYIYFFFVFFFVFFFYAILLVKKIVHSSIMKNVPAEKVHRTFYIAILQ